MIKRLLAHFPATRKVRRSSPRNWLLGSPRCQSRLVTQNEYARVTKEIFKIALADRVILKSPAAELKRRKVHDPVRLTPSWEQSRPSWATSALRSFNADAKDSGDFIEFMGPRGLGQAELKNLTWNDVDLAKNRMRIRRGETGRFFDVPIYPQLRPLLERLHAERGDSERVLKISDGKKALSAACKRLGLSGLHAARAPPRVHHAGNRVGPRFQGNRANPGPFGRRRAGRENVWPSPAGAPRSDGRQAYLMSSSIGSGRFHLQVL